jgi:hypothetical protein
MQIPSLRCEMTTKCERRGKRRGKRRFAAGMTKRRAEAGTNADSFAALRNDKQRANVEGSKERTQRETQILCGCDRQTGNRRLKTDVDRYG